ncbi:MAG: hypothetical protein P9M15_01610 [Candidatus Electryoneaceae bacterium]|nr:hypothetical protein [Candidatus Electryoneaceae bacterium]
MHRLTPIFLIVGLLFTMAGRAGATDFEEELRKLAEKNAIGYVGPVSTALGTAMNSGLYHSAEPHKTFPIFGFDVMVKFTVVQVSDEDLTYDFFVGDSLALALPYTLQQQLGVDALVLNPELIYPDRETPTAFGDDGRELLPTGADAELEQALLNAGMTPQQIDLLRQSGEFANLVGDIPTIATVPGLGIDKFPMVAPQLSLGLPMKSEVTVRYIPPTETDLGEADLLGIGIKHSLSQYIPLWQIVLPQISAQFMWQKLTLGESLESTHTAFNVHISKSLPIPLISITPYVGMGIESSNLTVDYTIKGTGSPLDGENVSFDLDGNNSFRMTGGVRLGLVIPFLRVTADYSVGEYSAFTLGVGLSFR